MPGALQRRRELPAAEDRGHGIDDLALDDLPAARLEPDSHRCHVAVRPTGDQQAGRRDLLERGRRADEPDRERYRPGIGVHHGVANDQQRSLWHWRRTVHHAAIPTTSASAAAQVTIGARPSPPPPVVERNDASRSVGRRGYRRSTKMFLTSV